MSLAPGVRLGAYEIVALIGAGGMGEVYRARDTRLGREVAVKVLPDAFTNDADRLARFEREAQLISQLNHPNICALYHISDAPNPQSPIPNPGKVQFLVLELVDGPTLTDLIAKGPIPVDEVLPIARQIAEALEAAHEHGIVHRDLKPANIKLRSDGSVKVLDFGLAKALEKSEVGRNVSSADMSPTITSPALATNAGVILGTAAYMSPEQAKGQPIDKRSDIWAFGCVLFEMLSGQRAFAGDGVSDTLAVVLRGEPPWNDLPADVSPAMRVCLRRCLQKSPRDRVHDIADVRLALDGAFDVPAPVATPASRSRYPSRAAIAGAALVLVALGALAGWNAGRAPASVASPTRRFVVTASPAQLSTANMNRDFAIAPDGSRLAYFASAEGKRQLHARSLDALQGTPIRDNELGYEPFFSPDGQWIAFNDETDFTLRKIAVTGGPPISIATVGREILGASWGPDDSIIFATSEPGTGLWRVSANGGKPVELTKPDPARGELSLAWPEFLPGGRGVVYTIRMSTGFQLGALDIASGERKVLTPAGTAPRFAAPGYLVYGVDDALFAVRFDPDRLELMGQPVAVVKGIAPKPNGSVGFAVSRDGTLVYAPGSDAANQRRLMWVDRTGKAEPLSAPPRLYVSARLSPDGSRVVLDIRDQRTGTFIWDINREVLTPLPSGAQLDSTPAWMPDGSRLVLASGDRGARNIVIRAADGTGAVEHLTTSSNDQVIDSLSPDGSTIVFTEAMANTGLDLLMVSPGPPRKVLPLLQTRYSERNGELSPDGKLVAYESDESGIYEVWVRPFPNVESARVQVSTHGGVQPIWSGRELLYVTPDGRMMSATVGTSPTLRATAPRPVMNVRPYFFGMYRRTYDVKQDGKRFLMIEKSPGSEGIVVVLNWVEELKKVLGK